MSDVVAAIDAAIGCQHCEAPLGESPSSDFCCEECQSAWHAAHVHPLPSGELVVLRGFSLEIIRFENGPAHGDYIAVGAPRDARAEVPAHLSRFAVDPVQGAGWAVYLLVTREDGRRVYLFNHTTHILPVSEGLRAALDGLREAASLAVQGISALAAAASPPDGA
ncbi:hypothetical protein [Actinophytocola sp.]|uniref:hypothetical protein n=1 Tax=Actinophytocola sp. TaxID=1872138 RepID=UPI002D74CA35|nr:hypothetical protein [Actinophytocola sp.]HYQ69050.1 hypothetical protein [Actinophytocola sp.]